jgi:hypothetical protein
MQISAIIGLFGIDVIFLLVLLIPNKPIGNLFYISFVPFFIGLLGFFISASLWGILYGSN